jgi:hypothetical protein
MSFSRVRRRRRRRRGGRRRRMRRGRGERERAKDVESNFDETEYWRSVEIN